MKKIKLLTAGASVATVAGVVLPLSSCVTNKATNEFIEIVGPSQLSMHHGQGGEATFRAFERSGVDVTGSIKWNVDVVDSCISINSGHLTWTSEFTRKYAAIEHIYISGEYQGRKIRGYQVSIGWNDSDIIVKYEGPKQWTIDEGAPYIIKDTTALQVISEGRILAKNEYTTKIVEIVTSSKGDLTINEDGSINVGAWKMPEDEIGIEDVHFGIQIELKKDPTVFTALNGLCLDLKECDLNANIPEGGGSFTIYYGTAGESPKQYALTKNGKDITDDENVTDIGIWAETTMGHEVAFPSLSYNRVTRKIQWQEDFEDIPALYKYIYIKYKYTNPVTHQVHDVKCNPIQIDPTYINIQLSGDEGVEDFNIDECLEFSDFTWSKNVYFQKSDEYPLSPTPLDVKYLNVYPSEASDYGKYPTGLEIKVEKINNDKIKIIPKFKHEGLIAGKYAFYANFEYDGPGLKMIEALVFELNVKQKSIEPTNYSTSLAGQELEDGSDKKEWNVHYETWEGPKNVAADCKYTLVNDGSTQIPEGSIYIDKSDNKVVTKWKKELNPGNYKFHFDLEYEYDSQKYRASSKTIELTIGLAKLVLVNAPSSVSATEWVSDTDSTKMIAKLQWEDGKEEDVSADATWSIVGSDKAKKCFSVAPNEDKSHWSIHWKNTINKDTVPSGENIKVKVDLTRGSKVYEASVSNAITVNMTNDSLKMSGGSTKITATVKKGGEADKAWSCELNYGTIGEDDKLTYSLEKLPEDLKGKVKIDSKGLVTCEPDIKPTTSVEPYKFTVKATLQKSGRAEAYTDSAEVELLVKDETQVLFEQMSWSDLIKTVNLDNGLEKLREIIWLDKGIGFEGLTKTIQLNVDGQQRTYTTRIIGSNHDTLSDGTSKKAPLTFEVMELTYSGAAFSENDNNCWYDGKDSCSLRTKLSNMAKDMFPSEVYNNIKEVNKVCATKEVKDGQHVTVTSKDKVWLPSATELGANTEAESFIWAKEGTPYKYYEMAEPASEAIRTKYLWNEDGEQIIKGIYWTRSPSEPRHDAVSVCAVWGNGCIDSMDASDANQFISLCFCL